MEEFQKIASEGKSLTNEEVKQKLKNYGNTSNRII